MKSNKGAKEEKKQAKAEQKLREKEQKALEKSRKKHEKAGSSSSLPQLNPSTYFGIPFTSPGWETGAVTFMTTAIQWLEAPNKGRLDESGIYRLSGSISDVQRIKAAFAADPSYAIADHEEIHSIAGVIKLFFREMPEPLFPYSMYNAFIAAAEADDENRLPTIQRLISLLPRSNAHVLSLLLYHLYTVAQHSGSNLMDIKNLAIVFAPNLIRPKDETPEVVLVDAPFATGLMILLMTNPTYFFFGSPSPSPLEQSVAPAPVVTISVTAPTEDEYDRAAREMDPLVLAYYIQHYEGLGYDVVNAKKWAVYYLHHQQQQQQQEKAQHLSAHSSPTHSAAYSPAISPNTSPASTPTVSPRTSISSGSGSAPPRTAPPAAPNRPPPPAPGPTPEGAAPSHALAHARLRLDSTQRARAGSINRLRAAHASKSQSEYEQDMQKMLAQYRDGDAGEFIAKLENQ